MTKVTADILSTLLFGTFLGLLIVFGPLAVIWSLNTLFPILAIPYNFYTWFAVVLLNLTWMSKSVIKKD
jgi:cobalamin biosynthesis protein CobD/CbiB